MVKDKSLKYILFKSFYVKLAKHVKINHLQLTVSLHGKVSGYDEVVFLQV